MPNDSNYNPINPMGVFPNWIFCPKIVPLVYDDSLSYYEFLNKLMVKLNEVITFANQINANVDYLRTIVERIQALIEGFDERITQNEADIDALQTAVNAINGAIENINSSIDSIGDRVDTLEDGLEDLAASVEQEIATAIVPLQTSVSALELAVGGIETRLQTVEQAAFDPTQIAIPPVPFNFAMSTCNGNKNGMRIVVDGSTSDRDSIRWVDEGSYTQNQQPPNNILNTVFKMPQFETYGNACHLVIPNVFPYKYNGKADSRINYSLYFYANRYYDRNHTDNIWVRKVGPITLNELLQTGGVQQEVINDDKICFIDMEVHVNQETGAYDLYIFNGRNGKYQTIGSYKPSSIIISTLDLGDVTNWTGAQKYFNLLNAHGINAYNFVDLKTSAALNEAKSYADDVAQSQAALVEENAFEAIFNGTENVFTPSTGVTLVNNKSCQKSVSGLGMWQYIDLTVDVANLADSTSKVLGSFSTHPLRGHNITVQIEKANNGCFGSYDSSGNITIMGFGTFGDSVRVRVMGYISDSAT